MGPRIVLFILAYIMDFSSSLGENVARHHKVRHKHRKSIGSDLRQLMGALRQDNVSSPIEQIHNFTQLVMNFVNSSYKCGSEEAQKIVPQIIMMLKGIFKMPFVDYFVDSDTQEEVLKALEECGSKKIKRERKRKRGKKRHRNKVDETEWRAFFTGAIENAEPKESEHKPVHAPKPNKTLKINFKSLLDDIIKAESTKSQEKSKDALLRIILEIDDYLQREKKRNKSDSRFKRITNGKRESTKITEDANESTSNKDYKKDFEESIYSKSNRELAKDVDDASLSKSNREYKKNMDKASGGASMSRELRADSGTIELRTSDEVVLDQNMEISVRMDGGNDN